MKQLTCEMCGSTDLVKDGGVFVCQTCGCKYSVEEAKKMMIEGTVEVQGTVKVDNAQKLNNLRKLAQRAKDEGDSETATKYFEQILIEDPNDWRANFYTIYYAAHNVKVAQIGQAANRVGNIIGTVFEIIKDTIADRAEQEAAYVEIGEAVLQFNNLLSDNVLQHHGSGLDGMRKSIEEWLIPAMSMVVVTGDKTVEVFGDIVQAEKLYKTVRFGSEAFAALSPKVEELDKAIAARLMNLKNQEAIKAQRARVEYWRNHPEEKLALDTEKEQLEKQIADLEDQLSKLPEVAAIKEIENNISSKEKELDGLGLFKIKEKKAIQSHINELNSRLFSAKQAKFDAESPLQDSISKLRRRISEIDKEFSKDR